MQDKDRSGQGTKATDERGASDRATTNEDGRLGLWRGEGSTSASFSRENDSTHSLD